MKYYLAGPMSGLPDFNYPHFELAALLLREQGLEIYSPHEDNHEPGSEEYGAYFLRGLRKLLYCHAIIMLQGWERSEGAMLEFKVATKIGMRAFTFDVKSATLEEMTWRAKDIYRLTLTQNPGQ